MLAAFALLLALLLTFSCFYQLQAQEEAGSKKLVDFVKVVTEGEGAARKALQQLTQDVHAFAEKYPLPGVSLEYLDS